MGDDLSEAILASLATRGVARLPDVVDGEGLPLRVLQVSAPTREEALEVVLEVLDEHSFTYSYFNVTTAP